VILGVVAVVLGLTGSAAAGSLITSGKIKDGTIQGRDIKRGTISSDRLSSSVRTALAQVGTPGLKGDKGDTGATGPTLQASPPQRGEKGDKGDAGDSYLADAYYSVAYYDSGDTNGGAIASVACKAQTDTAISGGVSVDDHTKNVPVGQSFPGRMDWSTNKPKPGRLDGWIIQFASQTGAAPEKVKVWALCVPRLNVPTETTFTQSDGS
jgi:hypothetical protein